MEGTLTLDDLKRKNAEEEEESTETTVVEEEESETKAGSEEESETEESAETTESENSDEDLEAWQTTPDEQGSEGDRGLADSDAAGMRRKYQGKIEKVTREKDEEIADLRAQLSNKNATAEASGGEKPMPTLESLSYDETAYQAAMAEWFGNRVDASVSASTQSQASTTQQQQVDKARNVAVSDHYERAATLSESSGIAPEAYQGADLKVRQMMESVTPTFGDVNTDFLISQMGKGSEKVMFYLGRNPQALDALKGKLMSGDGGMAASMYLGELKREVAPPKKRTSLAPKPAATAEGDESGTESGAAKAAKKTYDAAHKRNNAQDAFNAKKKARAAGIDTSNW